jgi:hypothetical protein
LPEATKEAVRNADPEFMPVGTRVEVRNRFVGSWSRGFEIAGNVGGRYVVRRHSDGSILPDEFDPPEVRPERHKHDFWWY